MRIAEQGWAGAGNSSLQPQNFNSRQIFVLGCFDEINVTQGARTALGGTGKGFILNMYFVKSLCNREPILL